jgi:flagellar hook-basal body complex protein FliE
MSLKLPGIAPIPMPDIAPVGESQSFGTGLSSGPGISFKDILGSSIQSVENARSSADQTVQRFLAGDGEDLHSTILASQRAELEFQMFLQVRNKVVSAYQEVMRMQM